MRTLSGVDRLPKLKKLELSGDNCDIDSVREALKKHLNHPDLKYNGHHQR
jgi:protein involved in ribonucleotide reduction